MRKRQNENGIRDSTVKESIKNNVICFNYEL